MARIRGSNGTAATEVLEELKCATHALSQDRSPQSGTVLAMDPVGLSGARAEQLGERSRAGDHTPCQAHQVIHAS